MPASLVFDKKWDLNNKDKDGDYVGTDEAKLVDTGFGPDKLDPKGEDDLAKGNYTLNGKIDITLRVEGMGSRAVGMLTGPVLAVHES